MLGVPDAARAVLYHRELRLRRSARGGIGFSGASLDLWACYLVVSIGTLVFLDCVSVDGSRSPRSRSHAPKATVAKLQPVLRDEPLVAWVLGLVVV